MAPIAAGLLLAGCAAPQVKVEPNDVPTYREGIEYGRRAERQKIVQMLDKRVGPEITQDVDTRRSLVNIHGNITLRKMAFAREREMELKKQCGEQYRNARRAYISTVWSIRDDR